MLKKYIYMILGMPSIQLKKNNRKKKELSFLAYNIHQCKRIALIVPVLD